MDVLSVRVVPHDEELGFMSVPDVEGEIDLRYHPVEHRGGHVRVRDLCRVDIFLELALYFVLPLIHRGIGSWRSHLGYYPGVVFLGDWKI